MCGAGFQGGANVDTNQKLIFFNPLNYSLWSQGAGFTLAWQVCAMFSHTRQKQLPHLRMAENSNSLSVWQQSLTPLGRYGPFLLFRGIQGGFINVFCQEHRGIIILPLFLRHMASETLLFYYTWNGCLGSSLWLAACFCVWWCSWIMYYINISVCPGVCRRQESMILIKEQFPIPVSHILQYPEL